VTPTPTSGEMSGVVNRAKPKILTTSFVNVGGNSFIARGP
jgi:hypothetical protein